MEVKISTWLEVDCQTDISKEREMPARTLQGKSSFQDQERRTFLRLAANIKYL